MRLFPPDWNGFLEWLSLWGELSIPSRRTFLDGVRPGLSLAAAPGDSAIEELKDAGLLVQSEAGSSLVIPKEHESFHHVMKSLERYPLFEGSGLAVLCSYLADHYSARERSLLHESLALLPNDLPRVAGLVGSVEWLDAALPRQAGAPDGSGFEAARAALRFFREQRDRVAIRDLEEYLPHLGREELCDGIRRGIQRAVFFVALRRTDLEPLIGIWPSAARRLRRMAVVLAPEPVKPARTFRHPYLVDDMTTLLLAARREPIPLRRGDEKPFIRFVEYVSPALLSMPQWLEGIVRLTPEGRIALAVQALRLTGLLVPEGSSRGGPGGSGIGRRRTADPGTAKPKEYSRTAVQRQTRRGRIGPAAALSRHSHASGSAAWREPFLVPAPWSTTWIEGTVSHRREQVIEMLTIGTGGPAGLFDLLEEEWTTANGARDEILPCLVQAFSSTPLTSFVRFHDFAEYQAAIESPLGRTGQTLTAGGQETALGEPPSQGWRRAAETRTSEAAQFSEEALEERWKSFLGIFLGRCLVSLDGAEAGATEEGSPCFRLTAQGRRMLGLPGDGQGDMSAPDQASPAIIVQPNFEIVFLAPSPAAEAELGRFCERKGRDVGVLFRITKESIRAAAASGLDARRVLDPLQQYARSELPPNVRQEIQGWLNRADLDSVPPAP